MGERGKNEDMKTHKTNLEAVQPGSEKPVSENQMERTAQKPEVRLGREAQARIGQQLRDMYQRVLQEGVPQHLVDLVHRLSDQE
jgi:aromatic ring-cleaving dioxygenase